MKKLIVLSLLLATPALAEDVCWGMPVKAATRVIASWSLVVGTEPTHVERTKCGGAVGKYGDDIEKWDCFIQIWNLRDPKGQTGKLFVGYSQDSGWVLASVRICKGQECSDVPAIKPCNITEPTDAEVKT
jgi:hypothetical protein